MLPESKVTLDHRAEAVVVDQLPDVPVTVESEEIERGVDPGRHHHL
jgi:hypothetical protein